MNIKQNRLLGAQEIFFYTLNLTSPKHFLITADISGHISFERWKDALSVVQQRHPTLSMGIAATSNGDLIFDGPHPNPIPLEVVDANEGIDWKTELEKQLSSGINATEVPLIRLKVINENKGIKLIIATHHSIGDALSVVYLINDILKAVAGKKLKKLPLSLASDLILGFNNEGLAAKIVEQSGKIQQAEDEPEPKVDYLMLNQTITTKLIQRSKAERTSVHGALQASAAISMTLLSDDTKETMRIMSPVSSRATLNIKDDFRLFITSKTIELTIGKDTSFWNLARVAKAQLSETTTHDHVISSADQMRGLIGSGKDLAEFVKKNFHFDAMLSNLGAYPFSTQYGDLELKSISGPYIISGFGKQQTIGAITVDGRLCLTNSSRFPIVGLLRTMKQVLETVI